MEDGKVAVPQKPGIGVEIDREVLERYGTHSARPWP
jgi:L-alanine-DL-glutamate epimerase-like enolase superfamily enzyme